MKLKLYSFFIFSLFSCLGCNDTEDLTNQVRDSISKELSEKNLEKFGLETRIISLDLVEKGNNEYVGILRTNEFRRKGSKYYNSKDTNDNNFYFEGLPKLRENEIREMSDTISPPVDINFEIEN